jgi:hypothetical protein
MHIDDELMKNNAMFMQFFGKKVREKVKRFWRSRSRMLNSVMVMMKTVMIRLLYVMLMMILILISANEMD